MTICINCKFCRIEEIPSKCGGPDGRPHKEYLCALMDTNHTNPVTGVCTSLVTECWKVNEGDCPNYECRT